MAGCVAAGKKRGCVLLTKRGVDEQRAKVDSDDDNDQGWWTTRRRANQWTMMGGTIKCTMNEGGGRRMKEKKNGAVGDQWRDVKKVRVKDS